MTDIRVLSEPRTYSLDSRNSFVRDVTVLTLDSSDAGALGRMAAYGRELVGEVEAGSREGRYAERVLRASCRTVDAGKHEREFAGLLAELRNETTGGGATVSAPSGGAAFVSPFFMIDQWAPYRGIARSFADQCLNLPLPPYGMRVYVPYFSSATSMSQQVEGQAVSETDPSAGYQGSGAVQTVSGQLTITQQLHDRGFSGGGSMDAVLGKQLLEQLDQQVDVYVLTQALAGASVVAGNSSWSIANLYQDIALGREVLTDTAGTRLRPTHFFTTSDFYSYFSRQVDTSGRPIVQPWFMSPMVTGFGDANDHDRLNNVPVWSRFTGTVLPGGVQWFTDDNIPNYGTTAETQLIVSAPNDSILLLEDDPVLQVFPQAASAGSLEITLVLREYVAAVLRHTSGTATIAGAAYTSSLL